ncbi:MAG: hypothetical protein HDR30_00830 [Lachnospiraceae bacterium]|nr:hypothetical protein [Lachnospiraceae bacterium]
MNDNFKYQPLKEDELNILWDKHKRVIESFIQNNHYDNNNIYINEKAVMAIIAKVDQRRKYFEFFHGLNMSECKEVALICFWYIKLQPICAVEKSVLEHDIKWMDSINEKLAVYYIIVSLQAMLESRGLSIQKLEELPTKYIKELVYSFTYRDISKEALILLVESIALFLGLDPYGGNVNA